MPIKQRLEATQITALFDLFRSMGSKPYAEGGPHYLRLRRWGFLERSIYMVWATNHEHPMDAWYFQWKISTRTLDGLHKPYGISNQPTLPHLVWGIFMDLRTTEVFRPSGPRSTTPTPVPDLATLHESGSGPSPEDKADSIVGKIGLAHLRDALEVPMPVLAHVASPLRGS